MRVVLVLMLAATCLVGCFEANYKMEELYGKWEGESMGFVFNEDESCEVYIKGERYPGETSYSAVFGGNSLEFVADGKVFMSNVTIKSLENDVLTIEMRPMLNPKDLTTVTHVMKRVAKTE